MTPNTEPSSIVSDFPAVENELTSVTALVTWNYREDLSIVFEYGFEEYEARDWARDSLMPWMGAVDSGAAESVFLGWRVPDYEVDIFRILLDYRF